MWNEYGDQRDWQSLAQNSAGMDAMADERAAAQIVERERYTQDALGCRTYGDDLPKDGFGGRVELTRWHSPRQARLAIVCAVGAMSVEYGAADLRDLAFRLLDAADDIEGGGSA